MRIRPIFLLLLLLVACEKGPQYVTPVIPGSGNEGTDDNGSGTADGSSKYDFNIVSAPLSGTTVLTYGSTLRYQSVMQSFALTGNGYMYGIQVGTSTDKYLLNITYKPVSGDTGKIYMQLPFAGHGSNMEFEREPNDGPGYIWTGSYGTWNGTKYTNSQTIARIPFRPGESLTPQQCTEQFYQPGLRNVAPALDFDSDLLAIWGLSNAESGVGYFKVYSLRHALALPYSDIKLEREITYGGGSSGVPEVTETPTIKARNLGSLTPLANIRLKDGVIGTGAHQGFEVLPGIILHLTGGGNDDNPSLASESILTVLDFKGKVLGRYNVGAISDKAALANAGITDTGFMEAEGVKVYDDVLYLGYATKHSSDSRRMVTIFKYDILKK